MPPDLHLLRVSLNPVTAGRNCSRICSDIQLSALRQARSSSPLDRSAAVSACRVLLLSSGLACSCLPTACMPSVTLFCFWPAGALIQRADWHAASQLRAGCLLKRGLKELLSGEASHTAQTRSLA